MHWENGRQQRLSVSDQMPDCEHYKHMEPKETMFKEIKDYSGCYGQLGTNKLDNFD